MRVLVVAALVLASLASAQTFTLALDTTQTGSSAAVVIGPNDCGGTHSVTWTASLTATYETCGDLFIWLTPGACGSDPDGGDRVLAVAEISGAIGSASNWNVLQTGAPTFQTTALIAVSDGGTACNAGQVDIPYNVCGSYKYAFANADCNNASLVTLFHPSTTPTVEFDAIPPPAPTITLGVGDTTMTVSASDSDTTTTQIYVEYQPTGSTSGFVPAATPISGSSGNVQITGLTDGVSYDFRAYALDDASNTSDYSTVVSGAPVATTGFFQHYVDSGGQEKGGCAAAAGLAPWLALVTARLLSRRRRS